MGISLKKHAEGFDAEEQGLGRGPDVRTGSYDVVNIELGRGTVGQKGTKKVRPTVYILKACEEENADLKDQRFWLDLWADLSKSANAKKMAYLITAHGNEDMLDNFDIDDDEQLAKAITGKPYRITIEVKTDRTYKTSSGETKTSTDIEIVDLRRLSKDEKAVYNTPKWVEIVGEETIKNPVKRVKVIEPRAPSGGGGGGGSEPINKGDAFTDPFGDSLH